MKRKFIFAGILLLPIIGFGYWAVSPLFHTLQANDPVIHSNTNIAPTQSPSAEVVGSPGHPASGTVHIVSDNGKNYVRYESFKTINGPDIYVYLSKDIGAKDYISLGRVRATEGNINYEIPPGIKPTDYPYVLTWCKTFGVLFNSAKIY